MEKEQKKSPWVPLNPQEMRAAAERMQQRRKQTAEIIQTVYDTETGRDFIRWLVVETRMFALSLGIIKNLREKYYLSPDYYTGQIDLAKKILEFLTPKQVADLTAAIVKETVEKKEEKYDRTDKPA